MSPRASHNGPLAIAELFRHDPAEGSLRLPDAQRIIAISEPLVRGLHFALVETLGDTAQDALYRIGYEWALQGMLKLNRELRDEAGDPSFDFWQTDPAF